MVDYSDDHRAYLITRHADVADCLAHPSLSSAIIPDSLAGVPPDVFDTYASVLRRQMDLTDGARHARLRRAFGGLFARAAVDRVTASIEAWLDERLDRLPPAFDVVAEIARPLPQFTVMELLGIPPDAQMLVASAVEEFVAGLSAPERHHDRVRGALRGLRTRLPAVASVGETDDLVANVILIAVAGQSTTTHLIGNAAWLLLVDDDTRDLLRQSPEHVPAAIDEVLRFESPVQSVRRRCLTPLTIGGASLRSGDDLVLMLGRANRDPDAFAAPDRFDLRRAPNPHVAFGGGTHACIGAALARLQAAAVIGALSERDVKVAGRVPEWIDSAGYRGLSRLAVTR